MDVALSVRYLKHSIYFTYVKLKYCYYSYVINS